MITDPRYGAFWLLLISQSVFAANGYGLQPCYPYGGPAPAPAPAYQNDAAAAPGEPTAFRPPAAVSTPAPLSSNPAYDRGRFGDPRFRRNYPRYRNFSRYGRPQPGARPGYGYRPDHRGFAPYSGLPGVPGTPPSYSGTVPHGGHAGSAYGATTGVQTEEAPAVAAEPLTPQSDQTAAVSSESATPERVIAPEAPPAPPGPAPALRFRPLEPMPGGPDADPNAGNQPPSDAAGTAKVVSESAEQLPPASVVADEKAKTPAAESSAEPASQAVWPLQRDRARRPPPARIEDGLINGQPPMFRPLTGSGTASSTASGSVQASDSSPAGN